MQKRWTVTLAAVLMAAVALTGCGGSAPQQETKPADNKQQATQQQPAQQQQAAQPGSKGKTVKLGYVQWEDAVATTMVAKEVLEQKLGVKVEAVPVDAGVMWTGVAQKDFDAILAAWLPTTHESYWGKFKDQVQDAGVNFKGAKIGLVVPEYVTIDSVEQIKDHKDKFKNRIVGIDAGAGIMKATAKAIKEYGLGVELVEGSDAAMTAALKAAIDKQEWIAITGWIPHWMFAAYKLKFLKDPKNVYGGEEEIHSIARKGLDQEMPDVYRFLQKFQWGATDVGGVMIAVKEGKKPEEAAKEWVSKNAAVVEKWVK